MNHSWVYAVRSHHWRHLLDDTLIKLTRARALYRKQQLAEDAGCLLAALCRANGMEER